MASLGPVERAVLHHQLRVHVRQGDLPRAALAFYQGNTEFQDTLHESVANQSMGEVGDSADPMGAGGKIIQWIMANWQKIYALIAMLLPLFGGPHLPPLPGPTPVVTTLPPVVNTTAPPHAGDNPTPPPFNPVGFALPIPPYFQTMLLQFVLSEIEKAVPEVTAQLPGLAKKLEDWLKTNFGG